MAKRVCDAQIDLLYANAAVGFAVTLATTAALAWIEWRAVVPASVVAWCLYMYLVAMLRYGLARRYKKRPPADLDTSRWGRFFAIGAGLGGVGWGAAGFLLYPETDLTKQVYLVFVVGGMMLGAASLLAARAEAFLGFLVPAGFGPTMQFLSQGDQAHLSMGLLCGLFTLATLITTYRIHRTIATSLTLQFENHDLVEDLRTSKAEVDSSNQQLEVRVQDRTAELQRSTEQLRAEIAQREHVEEELLRARKLESLGVLAGGIAHDFNNFLTIVQGNVEIARARLNPEQPVQEILSDIVKACHRAALLSSQLLTFAKGGAPVRQVVSAAALVTDAVHLARAGAPVSIDVGIQEDLWSVEVDAGQIGQALHNILLNARESMPEGGIIEVRAENAAFADTPDVSSRVRISIRDYGCGIPIDILPRIFDPYFTTKPKGRGLGLATAYAIVAKHGGHLSVDSTPGTGTVFTMDLPACRERAEAAEAPVARQLQAGSGRVLVMDDEDALRKLLAAVLTSVGYAVCTARDGAEAIALCEKAKAEGRDFDVALLDVTVSGGMGGVEAAQRLKELDPALKLIVSSGYSDASVMSRFREHGFDAVLPKPWVMAQVSEVFRALLTQAPRRKS